MSNWERVFEIADEVQDAFSVYDRYKAKTNMSYFHANDIPKNFDPIIGSRILTKLQMPLLTEEFIDVLEEKVKASSASNLRKLAVNDRVFLWLYVSGTRDLIKFSEFPSAAQSYIYVRDEELFEIMYNPNTAKPSLNRSILREIESRKVLGSFFKRIDDEHLADLLHRYPIDVSESLLTYRLKRRSKLKERLVNVFDCSKVRNQSHLRAFIYRYPWIMTKQTLEMMEASSINRDTWARLIADIKAEQRRHFPAGTGPWARRGIFVKHLKGRNSKPYKDFETGLPVDTTAPDTV